MKKRTSIIVIIALFVVLLSMISFIIINAIKSNKNEITNVSLYSNKAQSVINNINIKKDIEKYGYSKTLEVILEENKYNNNYITDYINIEYKYIKDFAKNINLLLDLNYNSDEINYIISYDEKLLNTLLNMEYINILEFKDIINFNIDYINRYLDYQEKNDYDMKTVVTYVNIGLDQKGYSTYETYTEEQANNDLTILVNKYHKLPDNYEPNDLVSLSYDSFYTLRKDAAEAYEKLSSAALIDNVIFYPFSAYRTFETQKVLYNRYKNRDGEELADTYSARPGFSEHQLGLAVDIRSNTLNDNLTDKDYEWVLNNSYKYGFIVRYPKGKSHITQFVEEPWHLRYLGTELATKVYESGLTYDEYYDLYLKK